MIDGVRKINSDEWSVFFIDNLSDALKMVIRDRLSSICYGSINANRGWEIYSYKATVKEFVHRYNDQSTDQKRQKGMIGELLFHVLMSLENIYFATSAFFNLEERSFKKGFDLSFLNLQSHELWIAEVKSGEKMKNHTDQTRTAVNLINTAKKDLEKRFSSENNTLWINAINHAQLAVAETKDEKKVVINLLGKYADQAQQGQYVSDDKNVILVGVLFHDLSEETDPLKIERKHEKTKKAAIFKNVVTIVIQQNTYEEVFRFLEDEAADE